MKKFLKQVCPLTALIAIAACDDQHLYDATEALLADSSTRAARPALNSVSATAPQAPAGHQAAGARKPQTLNFTSREAFCLGAISSAARINKNDISVFGSNAKDVMLKYQGYLRSIKDGEEISGVYARSIDPCLKSATGAPVAEQNQKFENCILGHGINTSEQEFLRPFHRGFAQFLPKKQIDAPTLREIEVICANKQKSGDSNPPPKPAQTKTEKKYFHYFSCSVEETSLPAAETVSDLLLRYIIGNNLQAYAQLIENSGSHFSGSSAGQCVNQGVPVKNPPYGQRVEYGENDKGYFFLVKTRGVAGPGFVGLLEYK